MITGEGSLNVAGTAVTCRCQLRIQMREGGGREGGRREGSRMLQEKLNSREITWTTKDKDKIKTRTLTKTTMIRLPKQQNQKTKSKHGHWQRQRWKKTKDDGTDWKWIYLSFWHLYEVTQSQSKRSFDTCTYLFISKHLKGMFEGTCPSVRTYIILWVGMETSKTAYLAPRPNRKKYGQFGLQLLCCHCGHRKYRK